MNYDYIKYEKIEGSVYITMNRPDVLNSFNNQMSKEFQDALDIAGNDKTVRAVCLKGEGRAFCAGQDLSEAISGEYSIKDIVINQYNPIILKIREIEKPLIAAVNGVAAGAGANIALACDIVIASEKASFIQSFSAIGLIPDSGGTYFLPRLIGLPKASAIMMLGDKIPAKVAEEYGMIYKCTPENEFQDSVNEIMSKISKMPTFGLALTKKALNMTYNNNLTSQLELEAELQSMAGDSYDYSEGVNAFLQKRKPEFRGQ
ncbi:MAG: enoyl-CoA hydratase/isomerase family protein [Candidatus Kapabacteria bacterium]|nr:enoyl-CoA hydratase/isomerase family protein [Ignavibacteriota bacterium]MCW5883913.1 enoyl-CoA hydratase/isomerase family protein [Candidatus Kapabacteria bacterium]